MTTNNLKSTEPLEPVDILLMLQGLHSANSFGRMLDDNERLFISSMIEKYYKQYYALKRELR